MIANNGEKNILYLLEIFNETLVSHKFKGLVTVMIVVKAYGEIRRWTMSPIEFIL